MFHTPFLENDNCRRDAGVASNFHSQVQKHPSIAYCSIHRYDGGDFYPGTWHPGLTNGGRALNIGFDGSQGDDYYKETMLTSVVPWAQAFAPDIVIVSCGFDAAAGDPLGVCTVSPLCFGDMTRILRRSVCERLVVVLEGGYCNEASSKSAVEVVRALLEM